MTTRPSARKNSDWNRLLIQAFRFALLRKAINRSHFQALFIISLEVVVIFGILIGVAVVVALCLLLWRRSGRALFAAFCGALVTGSAAKHVDQSLVEPALSHQQMFFLSAIEPEAFLVGLAVGLLIALIVVSFSKGKGE